MERSAIFSPPRFIHRHVMNEGEQLKLRRLAATVVATEILSSNLRCKYNNARTITSTYHNGNEVAPWIKHGGLNKVGKLPAPKEIIDLVSDQLELMGCEIEKWLSYHIPSLLDIIYDQNCERFVKEVIRYFVWTPASTIDWVKTDEKWIKSYCPKLFYKLRYRLACLNCMKDAIENLYPKDSAMTDAEIKKRFPVVSDPKYETEYDDIPKPMVWAYLTELMDEDEEYEFMVFVTTGFSARVVKKLLPKFNEIKQRCSFNADIADLPEIIKECGWPHFSFNLWRCMKDTICVQKYDGVFDELRIAEKYFGENGTLLWLGDLGMEVWRCASDDYKKRMFDVNNDFLREWSFWFNNEVRCNNLRDDAFILELLSDADPEYRKKYWLANWSLFVIRCESKCFAKLIEACLPDFIDVDAFLDELANSSVLRTHLEILRRDSNFVEMTEFIDRFVRDEDLKSNLKKLRVQSALELVSLSPLMELQYQKFCENRDARLLGKLKCTIPESKPTANAKKY